jgi:tetratricopeptide (TPR) repeat protein
MSEAGGVESRANGVKASGQKRHLLVAVSADLKKIGLGFFAGARRWLRSRNVRRSREETAVTWKKYSDLVWSLSKLVIVGLVINYLYQEFTRRTITVETITVPKTLEEKGFTSEVAALRLRDAVSSLFMTVRTHVKDSEINVTQLQAAEPDVTVLHTGEPDIVVPAVGLSLESLVAVMRTLLYTDNRKTISGDLTIRGTKLWLRLRVNGTETYNSSEGADPDNPDQLFEGAAREVVRKTLPIFTAFDLLDSDPAQALAVAKHIIEELPVGDQNVVLAYNLEAIIYRNQKRYDEATAAAIKAIWLDRTSAAPYNTLGQIFTDQRMFEKGIDEYRTAIKLDPRNVATHYNLGNALRNLGKNDEAIAEFREAIRLDPKNSAAHTNLGLMLRAVGKDDEAIAEYHKAIEADPQNAIAYNDLGVALQHAEKFNDAISEFKKAVQADPKYAAAHNNLGVALRLGGDIDGAIAEFRAAINIDPNNVLAHNNLGKALLEKNNKADAIVEFKTVLKIDPQNAAATAQLRELNEKVDSN